MFIELIEANNRHCDYQFLSFFFLSRSRVHCDSGALSTIGYVYQSKAIVAPIPPLPLNNKKGNALTLHLLTDSSNSLLLAYIYTHTDTDAVYKNYDRGKINLRKLESTEILFIQYGADMGY